jgi:hypothetical protein
MKRIRWSLWIAAGLFVAQANASTPEADRFLGSAPAMIALTVTELAAASPSPATVREEQARWEAHVLHAAKGEAEKRLAYQRRLAELRAALFAIPAEGGCRRIAIPEVDAGEPCHVVDHGTVAGAPGPRLEFLVQAYGANRDQPRAVAQIVHAPDVKGPGSVVAVLSEGVTYDKPAILTVGGTTLLHVVGHSGGTGDFPAGALFAWHDQAWNRIQIAGWMSDLKRRLPAGLGIRAGVYPDWASMTAKSDLWRNDDPNCCPSGGSIAIGLRLEAGRILLDHYAISHPPRN